MRILNVVFCLAVLAGIVTEPTIYAAEKTKSRILMLTQSQGFVHGSVRRPEGDQPAKKLAVAEIAMIELGQKTDIFIVDCTQDAASDFTKENLQNYDIVMFYTTGDLCSEGGDKRFTTNR